MQSGGPHTTRTFCRICTGFCGLEVTTENGRITQIWPDKAHAYSWRDFCAKGAMANELRDHPDRITRPMRRVAEGRYVEATWDEAITDIAARLNVIRHAHGPHAIATYLGNPGAANSPNAMFQGMFMAGLKSLNTYAVGSVDQNSFHANANAMYGSEMAILIPDVDHARCFLFLGMNPAVSTMGWLDTVPDGWRRILKAQENGADLIVVDPRQTPTTRKADTHVLIRPGEDWALLLGILKVVFDEGWEHRPDCEAADGVPTIRAVAQAAPLETLSARSGVPVATIRDVARRFATAETAVCVARTGVSQNRNGTL
ncbi:MAG TPA: molybdopterin-dependent oxidoreductase, partial [Nevskiaceae bacterium]|nr:molybdopterin-dependent oxidoreductase [Nevskiaceae bacterium]